MKDRLGGEWDAGRLAFARVPMAALDAIDRGILVASIDRANATMFVEEVLGDAYRDGRFPARKIEVEDGIMLHMADYLDAYGRVTTQGRIALAVLRTLGEPPPKDDASLWNRRAALLLDGIARALPSLATQIKEIAESVSDPRRPKAAGVIAPASRSE